MYISCVNRKKPLHHPANENSACLSVPSSDWTDKKSLDEEKCKSCHDKSKSGVRNDERLTNK